MNNDIIKDVNLTSKQVVADIISNTIARVESGELNPLSVAVQCAGIDKISKAVREKVLDMALDEAYKYSGKTIEAFGAKIEIKESGVKYDYAVSSEWLRLEEERQRIVEQQKALETRMKTASPKSIFFDADGTEISVVPKSSKTTLAISLK